MSSFEYDRAQTAASRRMMSEEAAPAVREITDRLETVAASQTERKWGIEPGALRYKAAYENTLHKLRLEFLTLEKRIEEFSEALEESSKTLEINEEDLQRAEFILQQKLDEHKPDDNPHQQSGSYSYNDPTPVDSINGY